MSLARNGLRKSTRWLDVAAIGVLVLLITSVFGDVIFRDRLFHDRDISGYYYPTKKIVREQLLGGEPGLWNPHYAAGQPMASNPEYEVFYPPQWLILLPDYHLGFRLHILLHFYLAAIGMYLLLRSRGLGIASGMFGGIVFSLSGPLLSWVNLLPILFTVVWTPWILLFHGRFLHSGRVRDFAFSASFFGLAGLVGEPTSLVQVALMVAVDTLFCSRNLIGESDFLRRTASNIARSMLVGVCGIGVSAVQLFAAIDHLGDSVRSIPFDLKSVGSWSMPLARPLELVFPYVFGVASSSSNTFWGWTTYPIKGYPYTLSIYLGLAAICFCVALVLNRVRANLIGLSVAGLSYLVAVGAHTPLLGVMHSSGVMASLRYPEKFFFVALFLLIVGASTGFDRCCRGDRRVLRAVAALSVVASLVAIVMMLHGSTSNYSENFVAYWKLPPRIPYLAMPGIARDAWASAALRGVVLAGICVFWLRQSKKYKLAAVSVLVFTVVDLIPGTRTVTPRQPRSFFAPPPIVSSFEADKSSYRIFHEAAWHGSLSTSQRYLDDSEALYWVNRNGLYPMSGGSWGFNMVLERDYDRTHLLATDEFTRSMVEVGLSGIDDWAERFMAMSNARYRLVPRSPEQVFQVDRLEHVAPVVVLEGPQYPRYYMADRLVRASSFEEAVEHFKSDGWTYRSALVDMDLFQAGAGSVAVSSEQSTEISLDVQCEEKCFLVVANTYHHYWQAHLDGTQIPLRRVNLGYQGVVIPSGIHILQIRYRNPVVRIGLRISILVSLVLAFLALKPEKAKLHLIPQ